MNTEKQKHKATKTLSSTTNMYRYLPVFHYSLWWNVHRYPESHRNKGGKSQETCTDILQSYSIMNLMWHLILDNGRNLQSSRPMIHYQNHKKSHSSLAEVWFNVAESKCFECRSSLSEQKQRIIDSKSHKKKQFEEKGNKLLTYNC